MRTFLFIPGVCEKNVAPAPTETFADLTLPIAAPFNVVSLPRTGVPRKDETPVSENQKQRFFRNAKTTQTRAHLETTLKPGADVG